MKRTIAFLLAMTFMVCACMQNATGQVTTNGGSGLDATYPSLASAIAALNSATISSPVVITLTGDETAPAGGYSITQLGGTAANPITIQGSGTTITAGLQTAGSITDAIFKIIGGDYITIQNFTMQENSGNTVSTLASNTMTEFGVALFASSSANGAQYNTIQNNTITLGSATKYQNAIGIFSTCASSSTNGTQAASNIAGTNSNNRFYGNTISGVASGFYFIAPAQTATVFESGNDIGGSSEATANHITFGASNTTGDLGFTSYSGSTVAGVYFRNVVGNSVKYNTINTVSTLTLQCGGVFSANGTSPTGITYTSNFSNNTINLTNVGTSALTGIDFGSGLSTGTLVSNNNTINLSQTTSSGCTANIYGIRANYTSATNTCNGNAITLTQSIGGNYTSGTFCMIDLSGAGATLTANSNTINVSQTNTSSSSAVSSNLTGIKAQPSSSTSIVNIGSNGNPNIINFIQSATSNGTFTNAVTYIDAASTIKELNLSYNTLNTSGGSLKTTGQTYGLSFSGTISTSLAVNNNTLNINRTGTSGIFYGIYAAGSTALSSNYNINNNTITLNTAISGSTTVGIYNNENATKTINGNTITITGSGSTLNGLYLNNGTNNIGASGSGNIISLTSSASSPAIYGIISGTSFGTNFNIKHNVINTLSASASGSNGPTISAVKISIGTNDISNNTIYGASTGAGSGNATVNGIEITAGTNNIYKNKIYDLSTSCTGTSTLISDVKISGGSNNIYNNLIGQTSGFVGVNNADALRAINITSFSSSTTHNVYYNTIYLNASSTGANFGTSGIHHTTSTSSTTSKLDLRNNIIVNTSTPSGSGKTIAYKRGISTLTNYASTSNNNLFYAGVPSASNLIFFDGTNSDQTLSAYQTRVSPRDNVSITENPTWLSTNGSDANFLHINTSVATLIESGGANIATYADDFDGDVRQGNAGYAGTGTAPDLGADEFNPSGCIGAIGGTANGSTSFCVSGTPAISAIGYSVGAGSSYQWQSSSDLVFTSPVDISGQTNPSVLTVGAVSSTTYYRLKVSCSSGLATDYSTVATIAIHPFPTAGASSNTGICEGQTLNLFGTTDIGTSYNWTGPNGFTSIVQNPSISSATTAAAGTYSFTATANGCTSTISTTLVDIKPTPSAIAITPAMPNVCEGAVQQLVAQGGSFGGIIGSGSVTASSNDNPFYSNFGNNQQQILVRASELIAAGVPAGDISSLSLFVTSGNQNMPDFRLSIAPTALTALSTIETGGFVTVYTNVAGVTSTVGVNTIFFDAPYTWDGTSNLILKFCWGNNQNSTTINNTVLADPTTYVSSLNTYAPYITSGANVCSRTTVSYSYSKRPKLSFGYGNTITWSPVTDLYTDANATIPYVANTITQKVYSKPTAITSIYTATVAPANGCSVSGSTTVTQTTATLSYNGSPFCRSLSTPQTAILNGTGAYTGGVYSATPAGLTINPTTGAITPSSSQGGIYTVSYAIPNCETITTSVTITSATIAYAGTPFCSSTSTPQTVTLSGTGDYTGGVFSATPAGLAIDPTTGAITPSSSTPGVYTISYAIPNCQTVTTSITITSATISYAGTPFCSSIVVPRNVTINGVGTYTGGTYSATPSGLTINPTTGAITPSSSLGGTYTVSYAIPNCGTVTTSVTITAMPTASISYPGSPFLTSLNDQSVTFFGTTGGVYTAMPTGLNINASTGLISPNSSTPNTYVVSYSVAAAGGCSAVSDTANVVIIAPATCPVPTDLLVNGINASGAWLNWTKGGTETAWNIRYKKVADATYTNIDNILAKPYLLSGLQASTAYVWNVQAICSGSLSSAWSVEKAFTTTVGIENTALGGMSVYSYNNQINIINNGNVLVGKVVIYDMIGQQVGVYVINSTDNVLINSDLTIGNYVVKVIADNKVGTYKLFIK